MHTEVVRLAGLLFALAGCAELGVISDGTSISMGKPQRGWLVDGARIPDKGEGFFTRDTWKSRGVRYGTDELVDLLTAVSRRMGTKVKQRLVIADLSKKRGGEARQWHASHQSGRDVDLLYYVRDRSGKAVEPDAMRVFDAAGNAKDGSGYTVDVPRMWMVVKEFLTAREAPVQWIFIFQPLAERIIEHAVGKGEDETLIAKARRALKQPGNGAPHHDHMHVRIYCSKADLAYGCVNIGPMELQMERDAEQPSPELESVGRRLRRPSDGIR
jgi:penicillin-insensitive murein endopeptidase